MRISFQFLALVSVLILASCSFGKSPATAVYRLSKQADGAQSCKTHASIQISEPTVDVGLETRRIAVIQEGNILNYYTGARWVAPVSSMLHTTMINSYENTKSFGSVTTDNDAIASDYILLTSIRDFQVVNDKDPSVKVKLVSKLIDSKTRNIVANIPVTKTIKPQQNKMAAIVDAFDEASAQAIAQIVKSSVNATPECE